MKTKLLFVLLLLVSNWGFSQTVKILNDRAIVAQHKRMVFEKWGDFYPYPKYKGFWKFKVQTNVAASTVWGYKLYGIRLPSWISPPRNRHYKGGKDIRPLKPTGLQNQRLINSNLKKKETNKIYEKSKEIEKQSKRDFAHWTKLTASADPLWLLYYKRMLSPLKLFPEKPNSYVAWKLDNQQVYSKLKRTGAIDRLQEQLDLLKHDYKVARQVDMPRGKRILLYHKTLIAWRKFEESIKLQNKETKYLLKLNRYKFINLIRPPQMNKKSDVEIVKGVLNTYKNIE